MLQVVQSVTSVTQVLHLSSQVKACFVTLVPLVTLYLYSSTQETSGERNSPYREGTSEKVLHLLNLTFVQVKACFLRNSQWHKSVTHSPGGLGQLRGRIRP